MALPFQPGARCDAEIHQPQPALGLVDPHHLGEAEPVAIEVERPLDVVHLECDVADARDGSHHSSSIGATAAKSSTVEISVSEADLV
jgi:hypothetical protein